MALSKKDIQQIAHLARIEVSDDEIADYVDKLSQIIGLVDQLQQVNTTDVVPMAHPSDMYQRLRDDEVSEVNQRELFQRNASAVTDGLYRVPKVLD